MKTNPCPELIQGDKPPPKKNPEKFSLASTKAKQALQDETRLKYHQLEAIRLKLPNAYTAALQDMLNA
jgi:hypothetical protein